MIHPHPKPGRVMRKAIMASGAISVLVHVGLLAILVTAKVVDHRNQVPIAVIAMSPASGSASQANAEPDDSTPVVHLAAAPAESAGFDPQRVQERIAELVAQSQGRSQAENLESLEAMSKQLTAVASEKSLDELAHQFQNWMGLAPRITEPVESTTTDKFDFTTAQLHDVRQEELADGQVRYTAVLIDALGRTLEVEMTGAEGRDMYALVSRFKGSPLLEKIYRQIAMPILDRLLQTKPPAK